MNMFRVLFRAIIRM